MCGTCYTYSAPLDQVARHAIWRPNVSGNRNGSKQQGPGSAPTAAEQAKALEAGAVLASKEDAAMEAMIAERIAALEARVVAAEAKASKAEERATVAEAKAARKRGTRKAKVEITTEEALSLIHI